VSRGPKKEVVLASKISSKPIPERRLSPADYARPDAVVSPTLAPFQLYFICDTRPPRYPAVESSAHVDCGAPATQLAYVLSARAVLSRPQDPAHPRPVHPRPYASPPLSPARSPRPLYMGIGASALRFTRPHRLGPDHDHALLFVKPSGLYPTCAWDDKVVRRLILRRDIAPRFPGKDDPSAAAREECVRTSSDRHRRNFTTRQTPSCFFLFANSCRPTPLWSCYVWCPLSVCSACRLSANMPDALSNVECNALL
jgi:hypothetical protein